MLLNLLYLPGEIIQRMMEKAAGCPCSWGLPTEYTKDFDPCDCTK